MNCSPISANCGTHTKIVIVALLASILVVWIGINARISGGDSAASPRPQIGQPSSPPVAPPVKLPSRVVVV